MWHVDELASLADWKQREDGACLAKQDSVAPRCPSLLCGGSLQTPRWGSLGVGFALDTRKNGALGSFPTLNWWSRNEGVVVFFVERQPASTLSNCLLVLLKKGPGGSASSTDEPRTDHVLAVGSETGSAKPTFCTLRKKATFCTLRKKVIPRK